MVGGELAQGSGIHPRERKVRSMLLALVFGVVVEVSAPHGAQRERPAAHLVNTLAPQRLVPRVRLG
jgi:hypothetical protein